MKKRMFSLFLALAVVISMLSFSAYADAENVWDGTSAVTDWYNTADTAYFISTPAQLAGLAKLVNDGTSTFEGKTVVLTSDIDLGNKNWTPIGETTTIGSFNGKRFLGTFEGLGHKISNVTVNVTSGYQSVGFFGRLSGKVKNTGFESLDIKTRENTNNIAVGSICSILDNGAEIINCYVKNASVGFSTDGSKNPTYLGGISGIALAGSVVKNVYADSIALNQNNATAGKISGAFTGTCWGTTSDGTPESKYYNNAGGNKVDVSNSYFFNCTFTNATANGLTGQNTIFNLSNVYFDGTETKVSGATIITDKEAFKSNNSLAYPLVNQTNSFPALSWETDGAVSATGNACTSWYDEKSNVFAIAGADDLSGFGNLVTNGTTFEGKTLYLIKDIDLSNISNWTPIGGNQGTPTDGTSALTNLFKGTLDGQNHVISGMKITASANSTQFTGLFNHLGGTVKNLGMTNANIELYSGTYFGGAGVVAYALTGGTAENVYVKNSVINRTLKKDGSNHPFNAGAFAAHIYKGSSIITCYAKDVTIKDTSSSTGKGVIGGIAGAAAVDYDGSKFTTGATNVTVKNSYAADFTFDVPSYNGLAENKAGKDANITVENVFTDITGDKNAVGETVSKSKLKNTAIFADGFKADIYGQNGYYPILENETYEKVKTGIITESVNDENAKITNTSDSAKSAYVVIVYYNNGDMVSANVAGEKTIQTGASENISITKPANCNLVKVFVFNSASDISPLNYAIEY